MQTIINDGWKARVSSWFPEREFFMRSHGQVRFIRVSPKLQVAGVALAAVLVLAWLVAMAVMLVAQFSAAGERTALLEREARVARAETSVSAYREDIDQLASDLEKRQAFIEQAVKAGFGDLPLDTAAPAAAPDADPEAPTKISMALPGAADLARIEQRQLAFVENLTRLAEARAGAAESSIRRLGLNPRLMVARMSDRTAQGGPLDGDVRGLGPRFERLGLSLARMEALENGLKSVPHNSPARLDYISSGFGYRSDPFTGAAAMHAGLDFRGPIGAPVYAAANGRISFAGIKAGYGNCIEITHGNGMTTRYAHLSGYRARVGESVAAGDVIGAIGNTGRSTGPHLHFEVRINDQAVNPRPFLEANAHVFEKARGKGEGRTRPAVRG